MFKVKLTHNEVTVSQMYDGIPNASVTEPRSMNVESQVQRMKRQIQEDAKEAARLEGILNPPPVVIDPAPAAKPVAQEEAPKPKNPLFRKN